MCRWDQLCLAAASVHTHLNVRVLLFDEVSPLTTYLDSRHVCSAMHRICTYTPGCAEAYAECSGAETQQQDLCSPLSNRPSGGPPWCSHLRYRDHRSLSEADGGDCFLVKCHTNSPCVKDWIPLYLLEPLGTELITLSWTFLSTQQTDTHSFSYSHIPS